MPPATPAEPVPRGRRVLFRAMTSSDQATAGPAEPAGDPFPRERFRALLGRIPRYLRLAWGLAGEPRLPLIRKAGVLAAAGYLASPIDLVPGIIPLVGQLDDLAVALLALRAALRALDPETRAAQLSSAGLAPGDLEDDLATLGTAALWLARRGFAVGRRLVVLGARAGVRVGFAAAGAARRVGPPAIRTGGRAMRSAGGAMIHAGGAGVRTGGRSLRAGGNGLRAIARRSHETAPEEEPPEIAPGSRAD